MKNKLGLIGAGVIALFYIIPLQDLLVSYLFQKGTPILLLRSLLVLKEAIIVFLGLLMLLKLKVTAARLFLSFFLLYSIASLLWATGPLFQTLIGFRTYLLLFFSFIIGERLSNNKKFELIFYNHITFIFYLLLAFSLLEYFILPLSIWKDIFPVMQMKREVANLSISNEYYDLGIPVNAFGELTRRLLGPFDEPLYMAYFTVLIVNFFVADFFYDIGKPKAKLSAGLLLVLLTQTRAILVGFILSISSLVFRNFTIRVKYLLFALSFAGIAAIISLFYIEWVSKLLFSLFDSGGRNIGHINAYIDGLHLLLKHPFGLGPGTATSLVFSSGSTQATENAFINIGLEIGFLGIILIFGFFIYLILRFRRYLSNRENVVRPGPDKPVFTAYLLLIQFTFSGLVAPHILTARIVIPFMLIAGWAYGITARNTPSIPTQPETE